MSEGVPANNVGSGAIPGAGVDPHPEPGVKKKKKKDSGPIIADMIRRASNITGEKK